MRIDNFLVKKKYFNSRTKAQQSIEKGEIYLDGKIIEKSSIEVDENVTHEIKREYQDDFVSLGGFKMNKALKDFNFSVKDFICVDLGASTGGFTDCLLQNGAKKVYAVDLNDSLLDEKLKKDSRVIEVIKNAKYLTKNDFNDKIDFISADLSFISETQILPIISTLLDSEKQAIILIKPQFEMEKRIKVKNGIIKDKKLIYLLVKKIVMCAIDNKLYPISITNAPNSKEKNSEFLLLLIKDKQTDFELNI